VPEAAKAKVGMETCTKAALAKRAGVVAKLEDCPWDELSSLFV